MEQEIEIYASEENLTKCLKDSNRHHNLEKFGFPGSPHYNFKKVLDSLINDGFVERPYLLLNKKTSSTVDKVVSEIGDYFDIYEKECVAGICLHHIFNEHRFMKNYFELVKITESNKNNPEVLKQKLKETLFISPQTYLNRSIDFSWTKTHKKPIKLYVEQIAKEMKFSYDFHQNRAGLVMINSWLTKKLAELGSIELTSREEKPAIYLKKEQSAKWIVNEMLETTLARFA